jgi:hypothetical protein
MSADIVAAAMRAEAELLRARNGADPLAESLDRIAADIEQTAYEERMGDDL